MTLATAIRQWGLPVLLALVALGAWQAADRADYDEVDTQVVAYDQALSTPMLSGRRLPRTLRVPVSDDLIAGRIDRIGAMLTGQQSCLAVSNGDRILGTAIDPPGGVVPASNQKLITTWAALEILGGDFTFNTQVLGSSGVVDGVLDGDLYLVGNGDPFLYTEDWLAQYAVTGDRHHTRLEDLADAVVGFGITSITGSVIGDETLYDDQRYGPWDSRLIIQKQSGPISALTVNEGYNDWPSEYRSTLLRDETDNPPLHAAAVFNQLLQERGIGVAGAPQAGQAPVGSSPITSIRSPALADMVTHVNSYSSNIGAELLLKRIGLWDKGVGSTEAGAAAVTDLLVERGLPMDDVVIDDGSGLAESNRVTCSLLVALLARQGPETPLGRSLSIGGVRGSLLERFVDSPAETLVLAKTGTLQGVRALAGYVLSAAPDTGPDRYVTFAQILNAELVEPELMSTVQEPLVEALVTYPAGPSIAELSPKAPSPT